MTAEIHYLVRIQVFGCKAGNVQQCEVEALVPKTIIAYGVDLGHFFDGLNGFDSAFGFIFLQNAANHLKLGLDGIDVVQALYAL
ncbi:hypothetical protein [Microbulbifer taiwanensis]|uniref:hypothetical protein n=1 Tax=Microbulbifer taiwanensis TaxID=986746 RepID=UPI001867D8C3|nr:hypothetical protein [Microbulbifer taiwanensis]